MRVCHMLLLYCGMSEAILTNGNGPKSAEERKNHKSAVYNNGTGDQIVPEESHERSAVYGEYYPEENTLEHGYNFDLGQGGGYAHHYPQDALHHHYHDLHPHRHYHHDNVLKAFLIPLAGVALLGAAAVFASNPILLQLGVVSGRRKRRGVDFTEQRMRDMMMLEKIMSQLPRKEVEREERRLLAKYLSCSGLGSACIERLACEVNQPRALVTLAEQRIMDVVITEIVNNEFIFDDMKKNIMKARELGHFGKDCSAFSCPELESRVKVLKE